METEYFGSVTESLPYKSSTSASEYHSSPEKKILGQNSQLKCFNCFGLDSKPDFCPHCGNTEYISDQHPLALLLGQVMIRKMEKQEPPLVRESTWDLEKVEVIREVEEEMDDKKFICSVCNSECFTECKYLCRVCHKFYVCEKCTEKNYKHQHSLSYNPNFKNQLDLKLTFSQQYENCEDEVPSVENLMKLIPESRLISKKSDEISESASDIIGREVEEMSKQIFHLHNSPRKDPRHSRVLDDVGVETRESFDFFGTEPRQSIGLTISKMYCNSCKNELSYCYSVCKTCESKGEKYRICSQCYDSDRYKHDSSHHLEPTLNVFCRSTTKSSQRMMCDSEDEDGLPAPIPELKDKKQSSSLEIINMQEQDSPTTPVYRVFASQKLARNKSGPKESQFFNFKIQSPEKKELKQSRVMVSYEQDSMVSSIEDWNHGDSIRLKLNHKQSSILQVNNSLQSTQLNKCLNGSENGIQMSQGNTVQSQTFYEQITDSEDSKSETEEYKMPSEREDSEMGERYSRNSNILNDQQSTATYRNARVEPNYEDESQSSQNEPIQSTKNSFNYKSNLQPQIPCSDSDQEEDISPIQLQTKLNTFMTQKEVSVSRSFFKDESICSVKENTSVSQVDASISGRVSKSGLRSSKTVKGSNFFALNHVARKSIVETRKSGFMAKSSGEIKNISSLKPFNQGVVEIHQSQASQSTVCIEPSEKDFIFYGIGCDMCGCDPIKNIRFHCEDCEDFDACLDCYENQIFEHKTKHKFQKIDGKQKVNDKKIQMLERKDTNKNIGKPPNLLGSAFLQNTVKRVAGMKSSIQRLGSGVRSMHSSHFSNFRMSNSTSIK